MFGKITGTGSYLPPRIWDNDKLSTMVDTNDTWIVERTGIRRRHVLSQNETLSDIATKAAHAALRNAEIEAEKVDLIIVATMSAETIMPSVACNVQKTIGAQNAVCFDLNAACTGFLFALHTAEMYIAAGGIKNALVIGAEGLSHLVNWEDRSSCILFGDGAGAVVLSRDADTSYGAVLKSDGTKGDVLSCASRNMIQYEDDPKSPETYVQMNGGEVFKFAVSKVPEVISEVISQENLNKEEIDYYVLHQANIRIIKSVSKRLGLPLQKFPSNLSEYGNTSSASIPILLDEMNRGCMLHPGTKLIISGFGGGLTFGAAYIKL